MTDTEPKGDTQKDYMKTKEEARTIPPESIIYLEGKAEVYAETVSKVGKPLASFDLSFKDTPGNWKAVKELEKRIQEKADYHGVRLHAVNSKQEYKDEEGKILTEPAREFIYYKDKQMLDEYLKLRKVKNINEDYHRKQGKIFGYTSEAIESFVQRLK
jgi:hypothetical protein